MANTARFLSNHDHYRVSPINAPDCVLRLVANQRENPGRAKAARASAAITMCDPRAAPAAPACVYAVAPFSLAIAHMSVSIPRVRSISLQKYSHVARSLGLDPAYMLRKVGIDQACLQTDDMRVPEASFASLLEVSAPHFSDASLGLLMGADWRLSDFGPISLALQHQTSLATALGTLKEYQHLLSSTVAVSTVSHGHLAIVQLNLDTERDAPGRHPTELGIAALQSLFRHQLGSSWRPSSVHFTHSAPASHLKHKAILGCDVVFNSDFDGIVLTQDELQRPHAHYDAAMEQHARFFLNTLAPESSPISIAQQVQRSIQSLLPHGKHHIDQVAKNLGLTTRSLQRQLEEAGSSYQRALSAVRARTVTRALKNLQLSIADVATLAGFAEVSSFSRWFAQHFQTTPSRWRLQHAAG